MQGANIGVLNEITFIFSFFLTLKTHFFHHKTHITLIFNSIQKAFFTSIAPTPNHTLSQAMIMPNSPIF